MNMPLSLMWKNDTKENSRVSGAEGWAAGPARGFHAALMNAVPMSQITQ